VVLNVGHFVKQIRNILKILKNVAGEGCRISYGPIVLKYEKYNMESRKKGTSYIQQKGGRQTGSALSCVGTAF
jgi:hypothetical protein